MLCVCARMLVNDFEKSFLFVEWFEYKFRLIAGVDCYWTRRVLIQDCLQFIFALQERASGSRVSVLKQLFINITEISKTPLPSGARQCSITFARLNTSSRRILGWTHRSISFLSVWSERRKNSIRNVATVFNEKHNFIVKSWLIHKTRRVLAVFRFFCFLWENHRNEVHSPH